VPEFFSEAVNNDKNTFMSVPVIDLFAGPGGLGEGFARASSVRFEIAVSIEKDGMAFETLQLRAAHRSLARGGLATRERWALWDAILNDSPWNIAFEMLGSSGDAAIEAACEVARRESWNHELGPGSREQVSLGIRQRLRPFMRGRHLPDNIVLIGGPPCQAYSVVGRSRNRGTEGYLAESDHRHFLYREYLHVINEFRPAVFVMENVKGILSSRVSDRRIFETITADLKRPDIACGHDTQLGYVLVALPQGSSMQSNPEPADYIVEAEKYGVPQARHRVIILGVREDVLARAGTVNRLRARATSTVNDVTFDLPALRPELSYRGKGMTWLDSLDLPLMSTALHELRVSGRPTEQRVAALMERVRARLKGRIDLGSGADRMQFERGAMSGPKVHARWYRDRPLRLLANHQSRAHMPSDLVRYLFVSAYGVEAGESPRLSDFPRCLLPEHRNVDPSNPEDAIFKDRFRVQIANRCSMTVTSHIGKDGHAFIHPDPLQCRSLTAREAARLQTFPDSYVFLGNRTSQYSQIGNAVPPLLAAQIAEVVAGVLRRAKLVL
jgi:DNA (cytosine-5)-methyltransferase 1